MQDINRIPRRLDSNFVKDLHKWAKIAATKVMGGEGGRNVLYMAEEAVSYFLGRIADGKIKPNKLTNDFCYISLKNEVINRIKAEGANKRKDYVDYNNLQLDDKYEDMDIELEYDDTLPSKIEEENETNGKIQHIINILTKSPYITDDDVYIFMRKYIDGGTLKDIRKELNKGQRYIYERHKVLKNVMRYMYNGKI